MSATDTAREVVDVVRSEDVTFKAAGITYYALASFVPLLAVALAALSFFGAADTFVQALQSNLPQSAGEVLEPVLTETQGRTAASAIGIPLTLWSAIKVFRGMVVAFDGIYRVGSDLSLLDQVKKSLVALGILFLSFVLLSAVSVALTYLDLPIPFPTLVGNLVAVVVLAAAFLPIYYVLPPVSVTVRHAAPGTAVAAVGWVVLQVLFFYYAQSAGSYAAYGLLGAILLFITFIYFGAIVLLLGAVVNVVLEPGVKGSA
jgi:membrane protein